MTASDERRRESAGGRADAERAGGDESEEQSGEGRIGKYFEYVLDLLSFL